MWWDDASNRPMQPVFGYADGASVAICGQSNGVTVNETGRSLSGEPDLTE